MVFITIEFNKVSVLNLVIFRAHLDSWDHKVRKVNWDSPVAKDCWVQKERKAIPVHKDLGDIRVTGSVLKQGFKVFYQFIEIFFSKKCFEFIG